MNKKHNPIVKYAKKSGFSSSNTSFKTQNHMKAGEMNNSAKFKG